MEQHDPTPAHSHGSSGRASGDKPKGDPWHAFGYLVSGVLFYGFLGWLADQWLDTRWFVVAGIFLGAGLGIYMTFGRFGQMKSAPTQAVPTQAAQKSVQKHDTVGPQDLKQENE